MLYGNLAPSWCSELLNSELFMRSYNIYRNDRDFILTNTTRGWGGGFLASQFDISWESTDLSSIKSVVCGVDITGVKENVSFQVMYIFLLHIPPNLESRENELLFESLGVLDYLGNSNHVF